MAITKEQLEMMVKEMVTGQLKNLGTEMTGELDKRLEKRLSDALSQPASKFPATVEAAKEKSEFKGFWEFASLVVKSCGAGRPIDTRMEKLFSARTKAAGTALDEGDAEYGGYLIPEEFRQDLLEKALAQTNIMKLCTQIPMATNSVNIPCINETDRSGGLTHGGITWYWLGESAAKTESRPKFSTVNLRLKKVAGMAYTTDEILQDSPISLEPLLNRMFTESLAWNMDNVLLNGTGMGQPLGILSAPCLVSVAKESGQRADTIVWENILKMYARMWNKAGAQWFANENTLPQLCTMAANVGTGGAPVYSPPGGASGRPYDTLMGKPLIFTEHCKKLGDLGDIYFADFSQYLLGQKAGAGLQFAVSIHLKFDYDQTAFRFVFRIDGQPWWSSALTPRYATSDTLSPFVALAERA